MQLKSLERLKELSKLTVGLWSRALDYTSHIRHWSVTRAMAYQIRKTHAKAAQGHTDASVLSAIRYLDSPTDYREYLGVQQESDFIVLDNRSGLSWRELRDLALIAFLVSMILLLTLRS
jgi:hypothetical protein